ncbi:MAG: response regulator transcription factor [Acidimicrobiales bacterium]|nr:response regulator transcription factor [Acidimicrobiales bacterium]
MAGVQDGRISVLIVEDHAMVAEALEEALGAEPGLVAEGWCGSIAELEARLGLSCPDVVVLDFRLPDGDAGDGARLVTRRCPSARVLVLSAWSDDHALARAVEAGCDGYVLKEQPVEDLVAAIRRVHDGEAVFAPQLLPRVLALLSGRRRTVGNDLTPREVDVLTSLAMGATTDSIADELGLSVNTVRNHVQSVLTKLGAHSRLEAVAIGLRAGLVPAGGRAREPGA